MTAVGTKIAGRFGIDGARPGYPGLHDSGATWNGWATPSFDRATVERIGDESGVTFEWSGDLLVVSYGDDTPEECIAPDADGRYTFDGWCWLPVTPSERCEDCE